jgi:hypothetical protein
MQRFSDEISSKLSSKRHATQSGGMMKKSRTVTDMASLVPSESNHNQLSVSWQLNTSLLRIIPFETIEEVTDKQHIRKEMDIPASLNMSDYVIDLAALSICAAENSEFTDIKPHPKYLVSSS